MPWTFGSLCAVSVMYFFFHIEPNAGWVIGFLFCVAFDITSWARKESNVYL